MSQSGRFSNESPLIRDSCDNSRISHIYHRPSNEGQSGLGLILSKLQATDVLQSYFVLIHLFTNDKFDAPVEGQQEKKKNTSEGFKILKNVTTK